MTRFIIYDIVILFMIYVKFDWNMKEQVDIILISCNLLLIIQIYVNNINTQ